MLAMQNIVGLIEIDAAAHAAQPPDQSGPLAMLLALAELLPETGQAKAALLYPGHRLRVCNLSLPVVFARLDLLRRDLTTAFDRLQAELEGARAA
jgi:hypothetical protein